jgi:GNAT superfamily N-acetyltransferase
VSVQLEALADEVFEAAAAQAKLGAQLRRMGYGDAIWNADYPDLYFLNGIERLVAPDWSVEDFERALHELMPEVRRFRALSRDPRTVAALGPRLVAAGYHHDLRVGMVQSFPSEPSTNSGSPESEVLPVADPESWADLEKSLETDGREHGWTQSMIRKLAALTRWRAANTPHRYFLAYRAGRPAGHVGLFRHGPTAYLHALYTWPGDRRHGVGRDLTLAMSKESRSMACNRLTLQCSADGYLPRFYARLGFRPVGEQHVWTKA